jgi:microcystin-dependent protein
MSYTSKYTGNEIDELLDKVKVSSGDTLVTNSPIGSIVPYIGVNAPENYLICDGRELNIDEYKELADHFKKEFGTINHYGGNGETTFAIPDLRNEFLRGYHGDKDEQLSGEVGLHQDATVFNKIGIHSNGAYFYRDMSLVTGDWGDANGDIGNHDTDLMTSKENIRYGSLGTVNTTSTEQITMYTSRPTNVAVLYCIKYKNSIGISGETPVAPVQELKTVLWEGESGAKTQTVVTDTITLSESVKNFDSIRLYISHVYNNNAVRYAYEEVPVEEYIKYIESSKDGTDRMTFVLGYVSSICFWEIQKSSTDTTITSTSQISYLTKVIGVKYSAPVIADTEEFATTEYVNSLVGDIENVLKGV